MMGDDEDERRPGRARRATREELERLAEKLAREDRDAIGHAFEEVPFAERSEEEMPPPDELKP